MKIYISGLYSGTNPQPGVGIARSIKQAYPDSSLIGVEYSNRCSGIHWSDFEQIELHRTWQELDLEMHAAEIKSVLDDGGIWISSNDLEILWLSNVFPSGHKNLLTPPNAALTRVAKPAVPAHANLPVSIPTFVSTELSDWDLHAFCRQHNWKVWLKGPYYEAVRIRSWAEFQEMHSILTKAWSTTTLYLQAHVTGYEESICFSAYRGELVDCVRMRKRDLTEMSKTWAGDISKPEEEFEQRLRETIKDLNWTGGAELEMVRDAEDKLWLLEVNPRYPAWVHGSTITGTNLPGLLIEAATGIPAIREKQTCDEFTRVVLEIPVRKGFPLPALPEPYAGGVGHSLKHPSGLLGFAKRLNQRDEQNGKQPADRNQDDSQSQSNSQSNSQSQSKEQSKQRSQSRNSSALAPLTMLDDIASYDFEKLETPSVLFLEKTAENLFKTGADFAKRIAADTGVEFRYAYSIKTNPDPRLLDLALKHGFDAEAISPPEAQTAINAGFRAEQIILNGPGKWWRKEVLPKEPISAVYCDSLRDIERVTAAMRMGLLQSKIVGIRLRTPSVDSRFGIPIDTLDRYEQLIEAIGGLPTKAKFAIHFHMASSNIGVKQWWHLFDSMLEWAESIESLTGRAVEVLDLGGGWFPEDWNNTDYERIKESILKAKSKLRHMTQIVAEPGKALAQPSMALAMRVLEIQHEDDSSSDVVVDGSIAELPMAFFQPHRIMHLNPKLNAWRSVGRGESNLLGRLCMEHDVVAFNVQLPESAEPGDVIVFCDAGAYDRSMSYEFGRG